MQTNNQSSLGSRIIGVIVSILVCCSFLLMLAAGTVMYRASQDSSIGFPTDLEALIPTIGDNPETPLPPVEVTRPPVNSIPLDTLQILLNTDIPKNDPYELACRLRGICNVERTIQGKSYQVGDREKFWVANSDTAEHHQIDATLLYVTPHSYFWVEDGIQVNQNDVEALMDTFESQIYPTNREFFGSESNPGVDGDPRIFVIYTTGLGSRIAGYFNSTDSYHPLVHEYSNVHEVFMVSATQNLAASYTYSTLAHEFVHMIQFASDFSDDTWITEGFAELGSFLNGYGMGGWDWAYAENPDLQLTDWLGGSQSNGVHYGQSFLYLAYFLDRFGEETTKALNTNPKNGLVSVDDTLARLNITDPQTGSILTADEVFMDWAAALFLKDGSVGDGRYTFHHYPDAPQTSATEVINTCPHAPQRSQVNQYGIDYISITCPGDYSLQFSGSTLAKILPTDPSSGSYAFWSNQADESNMTLTREFDFTNAGAPIELSFSTWYAIEEDWDYLYVEASTDGQNWEILSTPSGTPEDPSGNSYGWGYTGSTRDWIRESVDLSKYAGQRVQLRFEYVTDAAVHGRGFLLDDVRVEAIGYWSDFEADEGGWQGAGFVRIKNVLPQTYRLSLIVKGNEGTTVTRIPVEADQTAEIPLSLQRGEEATLIITGTTRFTRQPAAYMIEIK